MQSPHTESVQTYARIAGVTFLIAFVVGGFGEAYAPSQLVVSGNAAATAHNILSSDLLFRLSFVAYLAEAITDVTLAFLLFVLLRPVHANLALLAVLFRLMATATFAFAELFYFAPSLILGPGGYSRAFSPDQLQALALLSLSLYTAAGYLYMVFYGIASVIFGYLMFRSGYLPRALGALWVLGGLGFVSVNLVYLFAPSDIAPLLVPQLIASASLAFWLLIRGVDAAKWEERGARVEYAGVPG